MIVERLIHKESRRPSKQWHLWWNLFQFGATVLGRVLLGWRISLMMHDINPVRIVTKLHSCQYRNTSSLFSLDIHIGVILECISVKEIH